MEVQGRNGECKFGVVDGIFRAHIAFGNFLLEEGGSPSRLRNTLVGNMDCVAERSGDTPSPSWCDLQLASGGRGRPSNPKRCRRFALPPQSILIRPGSSCARQPTPGGKGSTPFVNANGARKCDARRVAPRADRLKVALRRERGGAKANSGRKGAVFGFLGKRALALGAECCFMG